MCEVPDFIRDVDLTVLTNITLRVLVKSVQIMYVLASIGYLATLKLFSCTE